MSDDDMDWQEHEDSDWTPPSVRAFSVAGYKSIGELQRAEIRPLTLLAGANSGGKSSLIQPILLLKQTLEAPYDPGSLLLDGPNVHLTSTDQFLSKCSEHGFENKLQIGFEFEHSEIKFTFGVAEFGMEILENFIRVDDQVITFRHNSSSEELKNVLLSVPAKNICRNKKIASINSFRITKDRFLLKIEDALQFGFDSPHDLLSSLESECCESPVERVIDLIRKLIHVPGLRGNPERVYKSTGVSDTFQGAFESYVASILYRWKITHDYRLKELEKYLVLLGLTWKIEANRLNDAQLELRVGRLPQQAANSIDDLVSIADVGFGVSQTLPVLVALLAANPGQVVYLEQPEIHLHPRAQLALAKVLAEAAQRGVIVIAETHSALLLQGVQTLAAKDELSEDLVKLHWVQRDETGMTKVNSADLDSTGAFGDWPVDFMDVGLDADNEYLSAVGEKLKRQNQ